MTHLLPIIVGLVLVAAAACGGGASPSPMPTPEPTSEASPGPALTLPELKLELIGQVGPLWYCDPDFWPIQRQDELDAARERWPELLADDDAVGALAEALGIDATADDLSDAETLDVYRAWKVLNAIALDPIGNDAYRFDYLAQPVGGGVEGTRSTGTITTDGQVELEQQAAAGEPICPICLAAGALVETPSGGVPVEQLRIGDAVWTLDPSGVRIRAVVIAVGSTPAPVGHEVVRLALADGRTVTASPGHPLGDGRTVGEILVGDAVAGSTAVAADRARYPGRWTFDIAVSGGTGVYLIDGIPVGSTLRP